MKTVLSRSWLACCYLLQISTKTYQFFALKNKRIYHNEKCSFLVSNRAYPAACHPQASP